MTTHWWTLLVQTVNCELDKYNVAIAALSETRFEEGEINEVGICWNWRKSDERLDSLVEFAITTNTPCRQALRTTEGVDDCQMTLGLSYFIWQKTCIHRRCMCRHGGQPRWSQRQGLWCSGFCYFCNTQNRQTNPSWWLRYHSWCGLPDVGVNG